MKVPCKNCICLPLCRNKRYTRLFKDCTLWKDFVGHKVDEDPEKIKIHRIKFLEFMKVLKPTRWYINRLSNGGGFILSGIRQGDDPKSPKYTSFLRSYLSRQKVESSM
jgi:hypothetical protein